MRPEPTIEKEPVDKALEVAGIVAAIILIGLPLYYWGQIPSVVPTHYNGLGEPDDYGSKWSIAILPVLGVAMFVGLLWLNRFPHKFNYPQKITESNAQKQYKSATRLIRILAVMVTASFAYLTYTVILTSLGSMSGPGKYFALFFTVAMLIFPLAYYLTARKAT